MAKLTPEQKKKAAKALHDKRVAAAKAKKKAEAAKRALEIAAEKRWVARRLVEDSVGFIASFEPASFDPEANDKISRLACREGGHKLPFVKAAIGEKVETSMNAADTAVMGYDPSPGDLFLLYGQITESADSWSATTYTLGSKVSYLGEIYTAAVTETGTNPPVSIIPSIYGPFGPGNRYHWKYFATNGEDVVDYKRIENPDWVLSDLEMSEVSSVGQSPALRNRTNGELWEIYARKGEKQIQFWDDVSVFRPDTTYIIEHVNFRGLVPGGTWAGYPSVPTKGRDYGPFYPTGTTFKTDVGVLLVGAQIYETSQAAFYNGDNGGLVGGKRSFVRIRKAYSPSDGTSSSYGGGNGVYRFESANKRLIRLNVGDGVNNAPASYSFLYVLEHDKDRNPDDPENREFRQAWISDEQGRWSRLTNSGVAIGKSFGIDNISSPRAIPPWRGKDAAVADTVPEWDPKTRYYPNESVVFNETHYRIGITDSAGSVGVSPLDEDYWYPVDTPGALVYLKDARIVRVTSITIDDLESSVRAEAIAVPDKVTTISSPVMPNRVISFSIDGEYQTSYTTSFGSNTAYTNFIYQAMLPITFTLSLGQIDADKVLWDFGDGKTSTEMNPTHTYQLGSLAPMPFKITATVTASNSRVYKHSRTINVQRRETSLLGMPIVANPLA